MFKSQLASELVSTYQRPATSYNVRLLFSGNKQLLYLELKRGKLSASTWHQLFHFLMNKINTSTKNWFHFTCATEVSKSNFNQNQKASILQEPEFDKSFLRRSVSVFNGRKKWDRNLGNCGSGPVFNEEGNKKQLIIIRFFL